jgi:hypothetical protein
VVGQVSATQVWHQFGGRARKGIVHHDLKPDLEKHPEQRFQAHLRMSLTMPRSLQQPYVRVHMVIAAPCDLRAQECRNEPRFEAIFSYGHSHLTRGHFLQPREGIRVFPYEKNQSGCLRVRFRAPLFPFF